MMTATTTRADHNGGSSVTVLPWLFGARHIGAEHAEGDPRSRPLSDAELAAVVGVGVATFVLGALGLVNSFRAVASAAQPSFGSAAWTVPLAVDIGILVFTCLDLVLARLDMRVVWLRLVPWSLVAVTIYLNIADQASWFGRVAHAVLPAMWVVAVEVGTHAVRVRAGLASTRRMDRIRWTRWLLAPVSTLRLWRRMVLWEIRSYPLALARERDRLLTLTELQDTYGRIAWRWRAPRRRRVLYRLGELAPDRTTDLIRETPVPAVSPSPPQARTRRTTRKAKGGAVPDVTELLPAARSAAARLAEQGEALTRKTLAAELRADGHQVGNAKLGALLAALRTHATSSNREEVPA